MKRSIDSTDRSGAFGTGLWGASDDGVVDERARQLSEDPRLAEYCLSERRAIVCHHFYLNYAAVAGAVDLGETIADWEAGECKPWRHEKMRLDRGEQLRRIERYRERLARVGRRVDLEAAAREWIQRHAASWRSWWERQPDSTPLFFPHFLFNFFACGGNRPSTAAG